MPPKRLGSDFKSIDIKCKDGHKIAKYRKPKSEWGHRTHKLWLIGERIHTLATEPPLVDSKGELSSELIPENDTEIKCGHETCSLIIGRIAMVGGSVAIELDTAGTKPARG